MAFGWLVDENKFCRIALTSDGNCHGLVKWTKEYEDERRKSNRRSDEKILMEKTSDLHEAIYMHDIKWRYTRPGSALSDLSFSRVWIGGEDGKPKKHFCWTFTPFGPNSVQRAVVGDDAARAAVPEQFRRETGIDPFERANFWFLLNVFPYGNVEVETVDEECRKILKPSLFLDPGYGRDGPGADQAARTGPTFAQIIPYDR